jgi:hypothetical protein
MTDSDRFRAAIDRALGGRDPLAASRNAFYREFPRLPPGFLDAVFAPSEDPRPTADFLVALAGILYRDWDGTDPGPGGWTAIRDLVDDFAGELDMDTVTYAMALVLERGEL